MGRCTGNLTQNCGSHLLMADRHYDRWKDLGVKIVRPKNQGFITRSRVHAPVGYHTDLASIPRAGWMLIAPWDVARAAIIHDVLYGALRQALVEKTLDVKKVDEMRAAADRVFLEGMEAAEPKIAKWKAKPCYWSVRPFGRFAIRKAGMAQT